MQHDMVGRSYVLENLYNLKRLKGFRQTPGAWGLINKFGVEMFMGISIAVISES